MEIGLLKTYLRVSEDIQLGASVDKISVLRRTDTREITFSVCPHHVRT